jgi:hypothetical protein
MITYHRGQAVESHYATTKVFCEFYWLTNYVILIRHVNNEKRESFPMDCNDGLATHKYLLQTLYG